MPLYIASAFFVGAFARIVWIFFYHDFSLFMLGDTFVLGSPDGYYFAQAIQNISSGATIFENAPDSRPTLYILSVIYKLFSFLPLDTFLFIAPAFIAPIITATVLPIYKNINLKEGLLAAILVVTASGFLHRTVAGYFDDDMFNFPFLFGCAFLIITFAQNKNIWIFLSVVAIGYIFCIDYKNAPSLILILSMSTAIASIFLKDKKLLFLAILLLAETAPIDNILKIPLLLLIAFLGYEKIEYFDTKKIALAFSVLFIIILLTSVGGNFLHSALYYMDKPILVQNSEFHYFSSLQTVEESSKTSFISILKAISYHPVLILFSLFGFYLLCKERPIFLILSPFIAIGFLGFVGGSRFAAFASIPLALGSTRFVFWAAEMLKEKIKKELLAGSLSALFLIPMAINASMLSPSGTLTAMEITPIKSLANVGNRKDIVASWWDYGYQIKYIGKKETLSNNGAQEGAQNFAEAAALFSSNPTFSANILSEYAKLQNDKNQIHTDKLIGIAEKYNIDKENPAKIISFLTQKNRVFQERNFDVYWFMPYRLSWIFGTISNFVHVELKSGKQLGKSLWIFSDTFTPNEKEIILNPQTTVDRKNNTVSIMGKQYPLSAVITIQKQNNKINTTVLETSKSGDIALLELREYNAVAIVDRASYKSSFVQMFFLENYDAEVFEMVSNEKWGKVFKLKK